MADSSLCLYSFTPMTLPMCMRRPVDTGVPPFVHAPACGLHSLEDTLLCACAGLWISPDSSQAAWELVAGGEISAPLSPSSSLALLTYVLLPWIRFGHSQTSIERFQQGADSIRVFTAFPKASQRVCWVQLMRTALRSRW